MPALLTKQEFDEHIQNKTLRIAFVGMSNAGKSYRSRIFRDTLDFLWYHVDEQIQKSLGFKNMSDISEWIGFPQESTYQERSAKYLEFENKFTHVELLDTCGKNLVFDTTGSVIYLEEDTINWLQENCLVINLNVGEDAIPAMMDKFFQEPKPLMWDGYFTPNTGETEEDTIKRCYPKLLKDRLLKYKKIANINIPAVEVRDKTAKETLGVIRSYLL